MSSMHLLLACIFFTSVLCIRQPILSVTSKADPIYTPHWSSLDARPLPSWYDEAKVGIFVHWGVYSVPAYACQDGLAEWYWWFKQQNYLGCQTAWHNTTYGPDFSYTDFAPMFKAQLFSADRWAKLFKKSGAKYVVFTTKHHEGWCNFPSAEAWNWNSVTNGPRKDLTRLIVNAVRKQGLRMGLYHSLFEWFHPLYLKDKANNFTTQVYVDEILQPQLHQIANDYAPDLIWADGDWEANDTYWKSKEFLAWLYNEAPNKKEVIVNDRWGANVESKHGGYWTGDDRWDPNSIQKHKWEDCFTVDAGSWGYNRNATFSNYLSIHTMIDLVVGGVAKNGNSLINVGPTADGLILPIFEERLTQLGEWLGVNGEAIYGTRPWVEPKDVDVTPGKNITVWYTTKKDALYATVMGWPYDNIVKLSLPVPTQFPEVQLLGYNGTLGFNYNEQGLNIRMPSVPSQLASQWAWSIKLIGFKHKSM
ncbi:alpha-L-fucosidase-like [Planoprotostelium fungivorum]|uniref:alpha-L-fucosidase n=1 Tax=Planoprotostelium fungivorum TaxID=1890364 RepID=A0A2P6NJX2_9EUKA|nr:alpha-L-fucosidase-like [Planoprotostelium fungivorum]